MTLYQAIPPSPKKKFCVVVVPRISDYLYLKRLYREVLNSSKKDRIHLDLYSLPATALSARNRFFYPFDVLNLLLKKKTCTGNKVVLHFHWIEFLYRWGDHKYLVPLLVLPTIAFFRVFKRLSKNKVEVTLHNTMPHDIYWPRFEYSFFRIMVRQLCDGVFVHSPLQKEIAVKFYGVDSKKVRVIQHGLLKNPISPDPHQTRKIIRSKLGISESDVVFSFIGAISEYKGVSVLLDAMKRLFDQKSNANIKLILAGKCNKTYLHHLLRNYRDVLNDKRVIFFNKHLSEAELDTLLRVTDFGICPYVNATTPATLFDFICYALPIITTDDPNISAIVRDYPLTITKRGDHLSLAKAINLAYRTVPNQEKKTELFERALEFMGAWPTSAELTLDSYSSLVRI